ncbi:MAG: DMT family transporter [Alphaproteobacteria bacterium]|nr:DMT family transporter [Alphaproteobacteria bacterium]
MLSAFTDTQKGIFFSFAGFSIYAISDASAKWLTAFYTPFEVVAWMYLFSLVFCILCAPILGGFPKTLRTTKLKFHLGRSVSNLVLAVFAVMGFSHLSLAAAYTIFFLAPFLITILAVPLYQEHVEKKNWLVIAAGFSGVLIAFPPGADLFNPWVLVTFIAMLCVAALGLLARPLGREETLLSLSFYPNLINTVVLLPPVLMTGHIPSWPHLVLFMISGACLTLGLSFVANSYRLARFSVVAPFHYSQIIWGLLFGYIIFGDKPEIQMLVGAAIIIGSGIYLIESERRACRKVVF